MTIHSDNSNTKLSAAERHKILVEWNNTQTDYPKDKCIHQLFEAQVERAPNAIAVVFEEQQLTYDELNRRANQLAHHLQSLGVSPEMLVGICVERSLEMVVGLLAILKAGGAYVPLDPTYPKERLAFMLADAQVPVLLTQKRLVEGLPEHQAQIVCLETSLPNFSDKNPVSEVTPSHLVYVIYTSGSTGKPKGVMMRHGSLSNLITWQLQQSFVSGDAKTLQFAPISFDVSCQEIFSTWCSGGTLVLVSERVRKDSMMLLRFVTEQAIERLFLPVVALQQLSDVVAKGLGTVPATLREIITAGEPLQITPAIANWFKKRPHVTLHNHYGPSESHVVTAFTLTGSVTDWPTLPPIGRPIANTQIYLLDKDRQPVPIGLSGELYIGGVNLARGYLNRPELTAEKFITHDNLIPHQQIRLYKTGDLARYRADGNLEFLGRIDHQVKIRGFRVELGEIEVVLAQHAAVQQAIVIVWESHQGDKRLAAYIIPNRKVAPTPTELRHFLKEQLPDYMVPAAFVMLEKLPKTPNGKIDRHALPTPDPLERYIEEERVVPHTPIDEILTTIWTEVLALEQIGIHDNFFELGGHSLLIIQIISRVQETLHVELSLSSLFDCPTIAELALHIETVRGDEPHRQQLPAIQPISRQQNLPLSSFQEQLWFLAQLNPNVPFYNEAISIHINDEVNVAVLEQSLNEIIKRHEALRTTFATVSGQPVQNIMPPPTLNLPVVDLRALPPEQREAEALRRATEKAKRLFDLTQDILLRATLVRLDEIQYQLFLIRHHLNFDGISLGIFLKELAILYKAFSTGKPSPLPELPFQYADFAYWQRQQLSAEIVDSQVSYWKTILGDNLPVLQLPTDHPRPVTPTFRGAKQYFTLSKSLTGLQTVGLDGKSKPYTNIEDMATHYIKEMQTVQPQGPYLLGGHSFGALVAFEISQQLQRHEVALLAIFDAISPHLFELSDVARVIERVLGKPLEVSYETLQTLDSESQLNYLFQQFKKASFLPPDADKTHIRGLIDVYKANCRMNYIPKDIKPTRITLFQASELIEGTELNETKREQAWGWSQYAEDLVDIHVVPGDHFTMMSQPNVQVLADKLRQCLDQVQSA
ncbi:MAG: hypothetical protein DRR08_15420 [Candidatus Parabeggiatoa sp. nov. 2]|nr:MAG: hypothetical protein B6247_22275 [Beggiatoa sp. 4572_84]RKZ58832.1 MAG: hypothetical protein DRR08_15420 [Gammaproteobacteria bacterium]HEC84648.1 amino acid adenylation domain-containing protein [Thioploca sp.]